MVMQVMISDKAMCLVVGILILVGVAGVGIAWGSTPGVHGHDAGEIEGGVGSVCVTLHGPVPDEMVNVRASSGYDSGSGEVLHEVEIPIFCRGGDFCRIILVAYYESGVRTLYNKIYRQNVAGSWEAERVGTADNSLSGENGDSRAETILSVTYLRLEDDWVGVEEDSNKWMYRDTSNGYYGELIACEI